MSRKRKKRPPRVVDTIPVTIDLLCADLGYTSAELAEATGLSRPKISQYRNGKELPTLRSLEKIADGTGKRLVVLFE